MGGSRIERMTGISVARETVRVVDGPETHPTSIKLQRGGKVRVSTRPASPSC